MQQTQTQPYTEKEVLADALSAQKSTVTHFNTFATECVHENVRNAFLDILEKEHEIQKDVFDLMHSKGFYPTPAADAQKVQEAQQKFSSCVKSVI